MTMEKHRHRSPTSADRVQFFVILRITLLALALFGLSAAPQRDPRGRYSAPAAPGQALCALQIHTTGFRNDTGTAGTLVFASPAGWPEDQSHAFVWGGFPIANHQADPAFRVPPGRYAAVVIHDENSNMKLDRNFLGIPKEGFGFSNNPRVVFAAPSFQTATVPVTCPATQLEIKLIYK
jgi:uncharacterized protein (DUF2141 family)